MKLKKLLRLFAGTFVISLTCSTVFPPAVATALAADYQETTGEVEQTEKGSPEDEGIIAANKSIQYLSDLPETESSVGYWGKIFKDCLVDNDKEKKGNLWVRQNGEVLKFAKGIGAHATSKIVYDISKVVETKKYFVGYLGIDARTSSGDGVTFKISLSDDKQNWQEVYNSGVVKGESQYVKVDLQGKKYILFYADQNQSNGNDHAVYANAGFVAADYNPSAGYDLPVKSVGEYDAELSQIDYNNAQTVNENMLKIYQRELVNKAGFYTLNNVYTMQEGIYKNALDYLTKTPEALSYCINGGPKPAEGNYRDSLIAFGKIYNQHHEDFKDTKDNNFYLRLAISVASVYANPKGVVFWTLPYEDPDPVRRYESFKKLSQPGGMMDQGAKQAEENKISVGKWSSAEFRDLSVPMMRWVVDSRMNEDEFDWLANYAVEWGKEHKGEKEDNFLDSYMYVHNKSAPWYYEDDKYYNKENEEKWTKQYKLNEYFDEGRKYGASVNGKKVVRSWIVWEEGGVCGSYAKTYTNLAEVFGRPSVTCGQPAHAAAVTWMWNQNGGKDKKGQYEWRIQNDVSNWRKTHSEMSDYILGWGNRSKDGEASSYVMLTTDVLEGKWDNYVEAKKYTLLANSFADKQKKEDILKKALEKEPKFLDAWYSQLDMRLADETLTSKDARKFAEDIIKTFKYYPIVMSDLFKEIDAKITDNTDKFDVGTLRLQALQDAASVKDDDYEKTQTRQPSVARIVAQGLLNQDQSAFATFSFDGEDAGKIVINSQYDSSALRVRYSLNGGDTWESDTLEITEEHKISLTEKLSSITPEKDILVSLEGSNVIHTIDILPSDSPKTAKVYLNDKEDLLIGNVAHLEYSKDNGQTWEAYPQDGLNNELRFTEDQTVSIRYAAHDRYITSATDTYEFTAAKNSKEDQYLPLKHVTLESFSSQNNETTEAAANLIDGNGNTKYHSSYGGDDKKELVFKFDEPRHLSSVEYVPSNSVNGRWKKVELYGSSDGKKWEKLPTLGELKNDTNAKKLALDSSSAWQYLKIKGVETYSSDNRPNKFFSGSMVNFYEDTTKDAVTAPANVTVKDITGTSVSVSWDAVEGVKGYHVFLNGEQKTTEPVTETSYTLTELTAGTEYIVALQAVREDGKVSEKTEQKFATETPVVVIPKPANVKVDNIKETTATVSWDEVEGALGYNVYVGDEKVNTEPVTETSYGLQNLKEGTKYTVSVETIEKDDVVSQKTSAEFTTESTVQAPATVTVSAISRRHLLPFSGMQ